jgi:hypothetical protein
MSKEPKVVKEIEPKRYRMPASGVEWKPTKYDSFKLVKFGEYRQQKGSARAEVFALAKDGMIVSTWTKKCADVGFDAVFAVNCIQKLMGAKEPGWGFSPTNSEGLDYETVKGSRSVAKAKEKIEKKAVKAAKKAEPKKAPAKKRSGGKKKAVDAASSPAAE